MDSLKKIVGADGSLKKDKTKKGEEKRQKFIAYADMYDTNLREHLEMSSLDLDDKFNTGDPLGWRQFLNHGPVREYINEFLDEMQLKKADSLLKEGIRNASDAVRVKKGIEDKRKGDDNSQIIVMLLPQKDEWDD